MKLKELTFQEQYLYEKPTDNYWRGISVRLGDERICSIEYYEDTHPISEEEENDRDWWIRFPRKTLTIVFNGILSRDFDELKTDNIRFLLKDKELAKREVELILEQYLNFFIKK